MNSEFPEWATEKQREGMELFNEVTADYSLFNFTFENHPNAVCDNEEPEHDFIVNVSWGYDGADSKGIRNHTFHIAWDYETTWDHMNERIYEWQFVFGDGCGREVTTELFFVELFSFLDKIAVTNHA